MVKRYFWNLLLALDHLLNAIFGGEPDETLSSRWGKLARENHKFSMFMCKLLHILDEGHCERSIIYDRGKPAIRTKYVPPE